MKKEKIMSKKEELTEVKRTRIQEGRLFNASRHCEGVKRLKQSANLPGLPRSLRSLAMTEASEDKKTGCQEDKQVNKSCHPEFISGSVHSEKWNLPWSKMLKRVQHDKCAFTLAEVLITLGIIGVVVAMTIPTMISNYQKRAWTAQLQKVYAVLNQGFRRMLADDGVSNLNETEVFNSIGGGIDAGQARYCAGHSEENVHCKEFYKNFRKYFKVEIKKFTSADNYKYTKLNSNEENSITGIHFIFPDGVIMNGAFYTPDEYGRIDNEMQGRAASLTVDVNGTKRPNKLGRDRFLFWVGFNGIVYPYGSLGCSEYNEGKGSRLGYWKESEIPKYMCKLNGNEETSGYGCTARVLEEGKMNY